MNKFLVIGNYVFGGDVLYVGLVTNNIVLNYRDKQITLAGSGNMTAADKTAIEAALVTVWGQSDCTFSASLQPVQSFLTFNSGTFMLSLASSDAADVGDYTFSLTLSPS